MRNAIHFLLVGIIVAIGLVGCNDDEDVSATIARAEQDADAAERRREREARIAQQETDRQAIAERLSRFLNAPAKLDGDAFEESVHIDASRPGEGVVRYLVALTRIRSEQRARFPSSEADDPPETLDAQYFRDAISIESDRTARYELGSDVFELVKVNGEWKITAESVLEGTGVDPSVDTQLNEVADALEQYLSDFKSNKYESERDARRGFVNMIAPYMNIIPGSDDAPIE